MTNLKNATLKFNGRKISAKTMFIEKLNWRVTLPKSIAIFLRDQIEKSEPFKNFKLEIALYYLSLISSIPASRKDKPYKNGYVPLHSKLLEKVRYDYKLYFDYFLKIGLLEKINYSTQQKRCNSYRYNFKTLKKEGVVYIENDYFTFEIRTANPELQKDQTIRAIETCPHLVEWFDHGLYFNYEQFLKDSQGMFKTNKYFEDSVQNRIILKAQNYYYSALQMSISNFRVSRDNKSDNRLHTNLTNMPKEFKKYISYIGDEIISLDIKNSQPYFLILFVEKLLKIPLYQLKEEKRGKEGENRIENISKKIYGNWCIMFPTLLSCASSREFAEEYTQIKNAILSGQYYEFLGDVFDNLKPNLNVKGEEIFTGKFYNKNKSRIETLTFNSKRDMMKKISMQLLYTPLENPSEYYKAFKEKYPKLCEFMEILKTSTESKDSFKKFPKLLQHIEADCVLDYCTKKVAEEHPDMPLFTIHDSIATTWCWFDILNQSILKHMNDYSDGIPPILEREDWTPSQQDTAA